MLAAVMAEAQAEAVLWAQAGRMERRRDGTAVHEAVPPRGVRSPADPTVQGQDVARVLLGALRRRGKQTSVRQSTTASGIPLGRRTARLLQLPLPQVSIGLEDEATSVGVGAVGVVEVGVVVAGAGADGDSVSGGVRIGAPTGVRLGGLAGIRGGISLSGIGHPTTTTHTTAATMATTLVPSHLTVRIIRPTT